MFKYAKLDPNAFDPVRKHLTDAGVDVFALHSQLIEPHRFAIIRTGLTFEIPNEYCLQVWPKSRNDHLIGAGILDAGYQGEVLIKVVNFQNNFFLHIHAGDPIAQLVLVRISTSMPREVSLDEIHAQNSQRGPTGGIVMQVYGTDGKQVK